MPRHIDFPDVISRLKDFYTSRKRLPSYTEMQSLFGYSSKGGVSVLVSHLLKRGVLKRDSRGKFMPASILEGGIKLLGTVQAGFPSPAEEELVDTLSLDEFLIKNSQASYLVKVSGDSMIDAGIRDNDVLVVDRSVTARVGSIVVAVVNGEFTVKTLGRTKAGQPLLVPANSKYATIELQDGMSCEVWGVVTGSVRKFR